MADEFVLSDKIVYGEYEDEKDGFITYCYMIETEDVKEFIRLLKEIVDKGVWKKGLKYEIDKLAGTLGRQELENLKEVKGAKA